MTVNIKSVLNNLKQIVKIKKIDISKYPFADFGKKDIEIEYYIGENPNNYRTLFLTGSEGEVDELRKKHSDLDLFEIAVEKRLLRGSGN